MWSSEARRILHDLRAGDFRLTLHARVRMDERGVGVPDIQSCAETVSDVDEQMNGKCRISGFDRDGDLLEVVAVWDGETLVITVIGD